MLLEKIPQGVHERTTGAVIRDKDPFSQRRNFGILGLDMKTRLELNGIFHVCPFLGLSQFVFDIFEVFCYYFPREVCSPHVGTTKHRPGMRRSVSCTNLAAITCKPLFLIFYVLRFHFVSR